MPDHVPEFPLPTSEELPCSDETPVDNELQNDIPNWLKATLALIWKERQDWFFGVDMAIYDRLGQKSGRATTVPNGFLSLGVPRHKRKGRRLSYVLAEENEIPPILTLDCLFKEYNKEYQKKMEDNARLGVLYYAVYNPFPYTRSKHKPFEVYRLEGEKYQLLLGEPVWMPEIGLGIGRTQGCLEGIEQEWLSWFDEEGLRYKLPLEIIEDLREQPLLAEQRTILAEQRVLLAKQQAEQERQRLNGAIANLQQQGWSIEQIASLLSLSIEEVQQRVR